MFVLSAIPTASMDNKIASPDSDKCSKCGNPPFSKRTHIQLPIRLIPNVICGRRKVERPAPAAVQPIVGIVNYLAYLGSHLYAKVGPLICRTAL